MGVFVLDNSLSDLASEGISNRNIDVISRNREGFDQQSLDQQASHHLALLQRGLEVAVQRLKEFFGEHHVRLDPQVAAAGGEAFHVLHFHPRQLRQFVLLIRDQAAEGDVIVVGFLLALDHDGVDAAVGILVSLGGEIRQRVQALQHSCLGCVEGRHRTWSTTFSATENNQDP